MTFVLYSAELGSLLSNHVYSKEALTDFSTSRVVVGHCKLHFLKDERATVMIWLILACMYDNVYFMELFLYYMILI